MDRSPDRGVHDLEALLLELAPQRVHRHREPVVVDRLAHHPVSDGRGERCEPAADGEHPRLVDHP